MNLGPSVGPERSQNTARVVINKTVSKLENLTLLHVATSFLEILTELFCHSSFFLWLSSHCHFFAAFLQETDVRQCDELLMYDEQA